MSNKNKKISKLYIHSFRGVPNELIVDFTDKKKNPVSTLIYGDNGSGKSTIVDALEYNLQGRIERSVQLENPKRPFVISYANKPTIGSETIVTFSDGTESKRGIRKEIKSDGSCYYFSENKLLNKDFSFAPIVLRRNDIVSYVNIAKEQRQVLFLSFLYSQFITLDDVQKNELHWENDPYIMKLLEEYTNMKNRRRKLIDELSTKTGVESTKIPYTVDEKLDRFIKVKSNIKTTIFQKQKYSNRARLKGYTNKTNRTKYLELSNIAHNIKILNKNIKEVKAKAEKNLNPSNYGVRIEQRREENAQFISEASRYLSESFKEIAQLDFVSDISLELGNTTSASMEIFVTLTNGQKVPPINIFSEANFDLLILLLYVSLVRACANKGQAKILILDDALQSVDSTIRSRFVNYIVRQCKDWQLIITCHDELWLNQLSYIFQNNGMPFKKLHLVNWNFNDGPKVITETQEGENDSLRKAILTGDKLIIASQAGVFLESICNKLSYSLSISIHRRQEDKYTLGDLWPGIKKALKQTSLLSLLDKIDSEMITRNMLGCHANEWAKSMSDTEVLSFANHVEELYEKVFCKDCLTWVSNTTCNGKIVAECKCRNIQYLKK